MSRAVRESNPSQDILALHQALSDLVRVYQFRERMKVTCYEVSVTQCYTLETLIKFGSLTLKRLAEELYLDKSTACRVVDALERKGYVDRAKDSNDARAVKLTATHEGRALYGRIEQALIETTARLASGFDPEVQRAAAELLARFAQAAVDRCTEKEAH